jgi:drug/metabolite transporter (DMT)-like permease
VGAVLTVGFGACLFGLARASTPWVAAALCVVSGACWSASSVLYTTLVQTRTPKEQLGRVMGVVTLALVGTEPLAFAAARWTGDRIGPRGLVLLGAVAVVLAGVAGMASGALRSSRTPVPAPRTNRPEEGAAAEPPAPERPELPRSRAAGGRR